MTKFYFWSKRVAARFAKEFDGSVKQDARGRVYVLAARTAASWARYWELE